MGKNRGNKGKNTAGKGTCQSEPQKATEDTSNITSIQEVIDKNKLKKYWKDHPVKFAVFTGLLASAIFAIGCFIGRLFLQVLKLPDSINTQFDNLTKDINTRFDNLSENISGKIDDKFDDANSNMENSLSDLRVQVSTLEKIMGINYYSSLQYSKEFTDYVTKTFYSVETSQNLSAPQYTDIIIAKDIRTGKEYTDSQLAGQTLLLTYDDNGKDVLFYGQYDNDNFWNGHCTFNIYENNNLDRVLDAEYNHGEVESFTLILRTKTVGNDNVWSISKRVNENTHNSGETWTYFKTLDYQMMFDFDNPEVKDVIFSDDFENIIKSFSVLEGYYSGNTINGLYNDDSGNAYMIKYREDGITRTLYVGNFKDGLPDDNTGNAWHIVFDDSNNINKYFYYKGVFIANTRKGKVTPSDYVTQEKINEIIKDMTFNCELNWYNSND